MWLAGGGIKPGISLGETDDFSYNVVDKPIHIMITCNDFALFGDRSERFVVQVPRPDQRLTGVEPQHVIKELFT